MKNLRFATLHQSAIGVHRECNKTSMPDLYLMPYSRFSAEDSNLWWLCTTKSRTAFKEGKFVVGKPARFGFDFGIVCGLHVERGVKQSVDSPDWKLAHDWKWHTFVDDMHGDLPDTVERACSAISHKIDVFVFAGTVDGPTNVDRVHFGSSGNTLSPENADISLNVLCDTALCRTWPELSRNLECLPTSAGWYWVDVFLVAPFSLDPSGADDIATCVQMLECFQNWLGNS